MMKVRDRQADPMKSPRLVTMLALACGVEETAGEEVERLYRTNNFRTAPCHASGGRTVRVTVR